MSSSIYTAVLTLYRYASYMTLYRYASYSNNSNMYEYAVVGYQNREHSTAQHNYPCTNQPKSVPIRVRIKGSIYKLGRPRG